MSLYTVDYQQPDYQQPTCHPASRSVPLSGAMHAAVGSNKPAHHIAWLHATLCGGRCLHAQTTRLQQAAHKCSKQAGSRRALAPARHLSRTRSQARQDMLQQRARWGHRRQSTQSDRMVWCGRGRPQSAAPRQAYFTAAALSFQHQMPASAPVSSTPP